MRISVVVNTYNWPAALRLVLLSLMGQTYRDFEIVIADDGSREETRTVINDFAACSPMPVRHIWQEDDGFRRAKILNAAISACQAPYLVFLDGDCLTQPDFLSRHRVLAKPNHLVTGSRILLGQGLSAKLCAAGTWDYAALRRRAMAYRPLGHISKIAPLFARLPDSSLRDYRRFVWRRIKGCNLACWKDAVLAVGGYNENMTGWGHEDAEFVFRMQHSGVLRRSGSWATEVLHLWHQEPDKSNAERNRRLVLATMEKYRDAAGS
ncbi:glycosyltransferase family 2 protein [Mesorhizobium sp.]|uniref:glycosyltransferase family 2 protein n=1 Tax=Mesorhizobium sp. TaxID=1871066 RepID=UPI0025F5DF48|nr:glycosyltransferase family 2 protein [Mesorhizobium sp.]